MRCKQWGLLAPNCLQRIIIFSTMKKFCFIILVFLAANAGMAQTQPVDYVSTLVGTQSTYQLSTGNTYPAIAMPWGMNF